MTAKKTLGIWTACGCELGLGVFSVATQVPLHRSPGPQRPRAQAGYACPQWGCNLNGKESSAWVRDGEAGWGPLLCHFIDVCAQTHTLTSIPRHTESQAHM